MLVLRSHPLLWFPPVSGMIAVHLASRFLPGSQLPSVGFWHWDKLMHLLVFGVLALFWLVPLTLNARWPMRKAAWVVTVGLFLFGCFDELVQSHTKGRSSDPWDVAADVTGAGLVGAFYVRRDKKCRPTDGVRGRHRLDGKRASAPTLTRDRSDRGS